MLKDINVKNSSTFLLSLSLSDPKPKFFLKRNGVALPKDGHCSSVYKTIRSIIKRNFIVKYFFDHTLGMMSFKKFEQR